MDIIYIPKPEINEDGTNMNLHQLCGICMENKGNRYLECFHNICDYCARQIRSCPYCRHQFSQAFLISIEIHHNHNYQDHINNMINIINDMINDATTTLSGSIKYKMILGFLILHFLQLILYICYKIYINIFC